MRHTDDWADYDWPEKFHHTMLPALMVYGEVYAAETYAEAAARAEQELGLTEDDIEEIAEWGEFSTRTQNFIPEKK